MPLFNFPKFVRLPAKHAEGTIKVQRVKILKGRTFPLAVTILAIPLGFVLVDRVQDLLSDYLLPDGYKSVINEARARTKEHKQRASGQQDASKTRKSENDSKASIAHEKPVALGRNARAKGDTLFIPLPYTRRRDLVQYKHTDKEWIEASKLVDDPARLFKLVSVIGHETLKVWARDKKVVEAFQRVGRAGQKGHLTTTLNVVIPQHRPPIYEQLGIEISPDGARLAGRPVSNTNALRIYRILYPTVLINSFWNAGKAFGQSSFQLFKKKMHRIGSTVIFSSSSAPRVPPFVPSDLPDNVSTAAQTVPDAVTKGGDALMTYFHQLSKSVIPKMPHAIAKSVFIQTLQTQQIDALQEVVPAGAVFFRGYITYIGFRGQLRSTISVTYLPGQDTLIFPVIVERTEILPDPHTWHSADPLVDSKWKPQGSLLDNPTPEKTKKFAQNIQQFAKKLRNDQADLDRTIEKRNQLLEVRRQNLAKSIDHLEKKMNQTAPAEARKVAAAKLVYTRKLEVPQQFVKDEPAVTSEKLQKGLEKDSPKDDEDDKAATGSIETATEPGDRKKE